MDYSQLKSHYDYIIVGAGLYGATFARRATDAGYSCLVIEKRGHVAGNVYTEPVEGINVHRYGAHIFHTADKRVWDFVNSLVPFNRYTNCPVAKAPDGKMYNLPFNMNTFYQMWGVETPAQAQAKLDEQRAEAVEAMRADGVTEPRNLREQALALIGRDIFEQLIDGYTRKQWGRPCESLPAFIIKRLPVRMTFDNNYFNDPYQGIPEGGYTLLVERLLEGVDVLLDTDFFDRRDEWMSRCDKLVYTGPIDRFYDYCHGKLQYRTVRFETEVIDTPNYQGNAVINYTSADVPYTRIIEHKHFETFGQAVYDNPLTVISREYSTEWTEGMEPYYPVNDDVNGAIYARYEAMAREETKVKFGGRLARYRYYDMAPVIAEALNADL
ncbi:MAG: UDP-galactopyranose mutase [Muribaculaceae bacterium]|nr:UDP-galactopyranose mutase [Muribaculaceae bacterium]